MTTRPRLEARVGALERRQINLETQVEELSEDMSGINNNIGELFDKHSIQLDKIEGDIKAVKDDIAEIKSIMATRDDIAEIKSIMATRDDIAEIRTELATMNSNMLDMFKQLISLINTQRTITQ